MTGPEQEIHSNASKLSAASSWIVEDDLDSAQLIHSMLKSLGVSVTVFTKGKELLDALTCGSEQPNMICLDLSLPDISGLDLLPIIKQHVPQVPVIVVTSNTSQKSINEAVALGVYDYLPKTSNKMKFTTTFRRAIEYRELQHAIVKATEKDNANQFGILGVSPSIRSVIRKISDFGETNVNVLVHGETGTGKELVSRAMHLASKRRDRPFIAINCAVLSRELLESELFGHEKGAFTGASARHIGAFERADGGTLFLDEIGELDLAIQAKLLRAIQEKAFLRVGGTREIKSEFRLVVATNRDLLAEVDEGRFRKDLYYRLAVAEIELPPLRVRTDDISLLAYQFVKDFCKQLGKRVSLSVEASKILVDYSWPGNVRELQNVIQLSMIQCKESELLPRHLPDYIGSSSTMTRGSPARPTETTMLNKSETEIEPVMPLEEQEHRALIKALQVTQGQVIKAAELLGISRATLYRKMKKSGISTRRSFSAD